MHVNPNSGCDEPPCHKLRVAFIDTTSSGAKLLRKGQPYDFLVTSRQDVSFWACEVSKFCKLHNVDGTRNLKHRIVLKFAELLEGVALVLLYVLRFANSLNVDTLDVDMQ
jgi:hypothetical protein